MFPLLTTTEMHLLLAVLVALSGFLCLMLGLYLLVARAYSGEVRKLAANAARLGQKGVSESVATLVSTSTQLVDALNNLVRTAAGIGVFLVIVGVLLLAGAYWIVSQTGTP